MSSITFGTLIKLAFWSIVVGFALAMLNITPQQVLSAVLDVFSIVPDILMRVWASVSASIDHLFSYLLLGAVIVVPVWLIGYLIKMLKHRRSSGLDNAAKVPGAGEQRRSPGHVRANTGE